MEKEEGYTEFVVRQTGMAYGVGIGIAGFAAMLFVLEIRYHIREIPIWIYLVIAGMFLFGIYVWAEALNRRLRVSGDALCYFNFLGKRREFPAKDISYGKAAYHPSRGRDCLRLYDREGMALCRLECSMENAECLVWYLHEKGITIELEKGAEGFAGKILAQQPLEEASMDRLSCQVYGKMQEMIEAWQVRNKEMGAEFVYGFACYCMESPLEEETVPGMETAWQVSLMTGFLCRLELYVQKDGCPVQDRKGRAVMLELPVFYKRDCVWREQGARLYYNSGWQKEMEDGLQWLEVYLPKHRFLQSEDAVKHRLAQRVISV